jgi:hypothetical protein
MTDLFIVVPLVGTRGFGGKSGSNHLGTRGNISAHKVTMTTLGAKATCVIRSDVMQGAGVSNRLLVPRDWCGSVSYFIGHQNTSTSFGGHRCGPNSPRPPKLAIERCIGTVGGDAPSLLDSPS